MTAELSSFYKNELGPRREEKKSEKEKKNMQRRTAWIEVNAAEYRVNS